MFGITHCARSAHHAGRAREVGACGGLRGWGQVLHPDIACRHLCDPSVATRKDPGVLNGLEVGEAIKALAPGIGEKMTAYSSASPCWARYAV
jgi:hypothetical protein